MISSGGVSLSLKICASNPCVQRYDSPFTPRFCFAGWNPQFCGTKARQTPAVRIRFRWRLDLLWSSLLANVRETQTLWAAACLQLTTTTLQVLCCFFLNNFFSADTTRLSQKTRWHIRCSKLTWRVWKKCTSRAFDHDETEEKSDFKAHVGRRESVEWQHCRGRHTAYASINEVLCAYLTWGTACNVILQGSSPPRLFGGEVSVSHSAHRELTARCKTEQIQTGSCHSLNGLKRELIKENISFWQDVGS